MMLLGLCGASVIHVHKVSAKFLISHFKKLKGVHCTQFSIMFLKIKQIFGDLFVCCQLFVFVCLYV